MEINRANLDILFTQYSDAFKEGMQTNGSRKRANMVNIAVWAMLSPLMNAASVVHAWLNSMPQLAKWVGTRNIANIKADKMTVVNEPYANAIGVKRRDIETDLYGVYAPMISAMGSVSGRFWEKLLFDALIANGNWADGAPFFGTSRVYGANAIVNKTTDALAADPFKTAVQTMRSYVGDNGEPLEVEPTALIVGPKNESVAFDLVKNTVVTSGTGKGGAVQNWAAGIVEVQVSGRLVGAYDDHWYLAGEQNGIKPGYVQRRKDPTLARQDDPNSDAAFLNNEFRYGVDADGAAFLSLPHLMYAGIL